MTRRSALPIIGFVLMAIAPLTAQKTLTAAEAQSHVGEQVTVCGKVMSTLFAERSRGSPTFLDVDKPYSERIFTVLIWGMDRSKFGEPETTYRGKRICVTGNIGDYRGVAEIVASEPSQLKLQ